MLVATAAALWLMSPVGPVRADNALESSSPGNGETVSSAPGEMILTFVSSVDLGTIAVELVASDESATPLSNLSLGSSDRVVRVPLPPGLTGLVSLRWKLMATDGHVMSGRVQFTIGAAAGSSTTTSAAPSGGEESSGGGDSVGGRAYGRSTPEIVRWLTRLVGYSALLMVGGLVVAEMFFASGVLYQHRAETIIRYGALALVVAPLVQTLSFVGDVRGSSFLGALPHVLSSFETTPGAMLMMRTVVGAVLGYLLMIALPRDGSRTLSMMVLACGGLYLFTLAYAGHSRSMGAPWLGIPLDMAHSAAAIAWLGGLVALLVVALPTSDGERALALFQRFSRLARPAVAVLVVSGAVQTIRLHTGITTLFTTSHGHWLVLKIGLVVAMLRVADVNRSRLGRTRGREGRPVLSRAVVRASLTEAGIGAAVVAVTAVVVGASF